MEYQNICSGIFCSRPNRFIAMIEIEGKMEICHVKNTGRCRELLIPGVQVFLEKSDNPNRKTAYDLIGVMKNGTYINMDSQAPNKVAHEWLKIQGWDWIKPECKFGNSRLDFYMEKRVQEMKSAGGNTPTGEAGINVDVGDVKVDAGKIRKAFMEVKGVTLEEDGVARFPDAPTERGIKHIEELVEAVKQGYEAYILFVIQMKGIRQFEPNDATHPAFGTALRKAVKEGVQVLAYDCVAEPGKVSMDCPVEIKL